MKAEWNSSQYLLFENQRNQPAIDLIKRISEFNPNTIADLGCGPGNSTHLLKQAFPQARIVGIDNSEDMIRRTHEEYGDLEFVKMDLRELTGQYDLLFSNACLQWIPAHKTLIPELLAHLNPEGIFAAQFPMNDAEPLYQIIKAVSEEEHWNFKNMEVDYNGFLTPHEYFNLLSSYCSSFQLWETRYYHNLKDHEALIEWVKGTRIRPYLSCLDASGKAAFENEILKQVRETYPVMKNGEVVLCFNRFFMIGAK